MRRASGTERRAGAPRGLAAARPLPRAFYARHPARVARALLGRVLVSDLHGVRCAGRIVEVEAYDGARDPASHAFRGVTPRNAVMFGRAGHAYVYFTYGMHHCLNLVTGTPGRASAVLLRALEPIEGLEAMRVRRGAQTADRALARGPGCVARALGITRAQNAMDLVHSALWVADLPAARGGWRVQTTPRIGIRVGRELLWRFVLEGHPCASGPRARAAGRSPRGAGSESRALPG